MFFFGGSIYGIIQAMFILFKTYALRNGPVSVTTLLGNCSLLISLLISLIIWKEAISPLQIVGVALLIVAVILCTYKNADIGYTKKWKFYVLFFLIFAICIIGIF